MFKEMRYPSCIQLEITNICNLKCRHCYNYWREDSFDTYKLTRDKLDQMLDEFIKCQVFNVVFSGGEPFINYEQLLYGITRLTGEGIDVSCDTNLMLATDDRMRELREAGLEHCLTSFNSHVQEVNDKIVSKPKAQEKILNGIRAARNAGIRVSVNMIISNLNKDHVYETMKYLAPLGINKFFTTRTVPSIACDADMVSELTISPDEELAVLDDAIRGRDDFGIPVGSLIQYPLCFLRDLDKYKDYVGRGCPAGKKMVCLDAFGEGHACVHEAKSYGNIFEIGLEAIWHNLRDWKWDGLLPEPCKVCKWLDECEGACRFSAKTECGNLAGDDRLMLGPGQIAGIRKPGIPASVYRDVDESIFRTLDTLKFRDEGTFFTVARLGADIVQVDSDLAVRLKELHENKATFSLEDFGSENRERFALLVHERLVVPIEKNSKA